MVLAAGTPNVAAAAVALRSPLRAVARPMYVSPPAHGAPIAVGVLGDEANGTEWPAGAGGRGRPYWGGADGAERGAGCQWHAGGLGTDGDGLVCGAVVAAGGVPPDQRAYQCGVVDCAAGGGRREGCRGERCQAGVGCSGCFWVAASRPPSDPFVGGLGLFGACLWSFVWVFVLSCCRRGECVAFLLYVDLVAIARAWSVLCAFVVPCFFSLGPPSLFRQGLTGWPHVGLLSDCLLP